MTGYLDTNRFKNNGFNKTEYRGPISFYKLIKIVDLKSAT